RWRRTVLLKRVGLVLLAVIAFACGWVLAHSRPVPRVEVVVGSDLLPATVFCDGREIGTLTTEYSHSTIEVSGYRHLFRARHAQKIAEKPLAIPTGATNALLFFSEAEFR